ncbi:MAG: AAA family ATPase [Alphaproteobacteria bacterium]|nr:AAA family ATPase [Alphaproteobacteria bacterium]MCL2889805.1 AAA family ATPase [Alphaproteobacteria bacterium]
MKHYILPLRNLVFQPGITVPIFMDNPVSIAALESAKESGKIILVAQKVTNYPTRINDLYDVGTIADLMQLLTMPDGTIHVMLQTRAAVRLSDITATDGMFMADATELPFFDDSDAEYVVALRDRVAEKLQFAMKSKRMNMLKLGAIANSYSVAAFIDAVIQMTDMDPESANQILCMRNYAEKLTALLEQVSLMAEMTKIDDSINKRINQQMERGKREVYLSEKLRALQREMGEDAEELDTLAFKKKIKDANLPKDAEDKALGEWKRMNNLSPMSNEGAMLKTYLDEILAMPWHKSDKTAIDLAAARKELDREHSGMNGVKERILEHLAVMKKTGNMRGTILCLVGAPGVGKTSLGQSVAAALGRKYQRISLGGVSDEAHFRGHRKTYIGAQPGRIMDALKRAGANNPVIVLDEIDKMGRDYRGDPEHALLEVLDPEQNKTFRDHYLEVDFDLSNVLFIATANSVNMSAALKDRMEIIEMPGYAEDEKVEIARNHLLRRAAADTGWMLENILISDDSIRHIIRKYTAEDGVRQLRREITAVLRRTLLDIDGADIPTEFTTDKIDTALSKRKTINGAKKIGFGARV